MRISLAFFLGLFVFGGAVAQAQETFWLKCRGLYDFQATPTKLYIVFNKAVNRTRLNEGECTWLDREVAVDEPNVVDIHKTDLNGTVAMVCSSNPKCYLSVRVFNDGQGRLKMKNWGALLVEYR